MQYWYPMKPKIRTRIDLALFKQIAKNSNWQSTPKIDGNRTWIYFYDKKRIELWSRYKRIMYEDQLHVLAQIKKEIAQLGLPKNTIIDGELWHPDIAGYQNSVSAKWLEQHGPHNYMAFDIIYLAGKYVTGKVLAERWALLEKLLAGHKGLVELAEARTTDKLDLYNKTLLLPTGEGIVDKDLNSKYTLGDEISILCESWIKCKRPGNDLKRIS